MQEVTLDPAHYTVSVCPETGIALVYGDKGDLGAAHPYIEEEGSLEGIRNALWGWSDTVVQSGSRHFNIDSLAIESAFDWVAAEHCQCKSCLVRHEWEALRDEWREAVADLPSPIDRIAGTLRRKHRPCFQFTNWDDDSQHFLVAGRYESPEAVFRIRREGKKWTLDLQNQLTQSVIALGQELTHWAVANEKPYPLMTVAPTSGALPTWPTLTRTTDGRVALHGYSYKNRPAIATIMRTIPATTEAIAQFTNGLTQARSSPACQKIA